MSDEQTLTLEKVQENVKTYESATTPYHTALGLFVSQFATLENIMNIVLVNISGVNQKSGLAIFSGTRVSSSKNFINCLLNTQERTDRLKERFEPYLNRIGLINSVRDKILHYGGFYDYKAQKILASNARSAHISNNIRSYSLNADLINDLTIDTITCYKGILFELCRHSSTEEGLAALQKRCCFAMAI